MPRIPIVHLLALVVFAAILADCNKPKPTKALITVTDSLGHLSVGAYVKLYANPSLPLSPDYSRLTKEAYTDSRGIAEFDYSDFFKQGQAGFAVLDILTKKDTLEGAGIIKVVEEETNEETVKLLTAGP